MDNSSNSRANTCKAFKIYFKGTLDNFLKRGKYLYDLFKKNQIFREEYSLLIK